MLPMTPTNLARTAPEPVSDEEYRNIVIALTEEWIRKPTPDELDTVEGNIHGVAKWPSYITDGPGFTGTVYVVLHTGAPNYITVVTKDKTGELTVEKPE